MIFKSRFIEMFGNVATNNKRWEKTKLGNKSVIGSSKRIFANEYTTEGIPFYRSKEIIELGMGEKPSVELYISKKRYQEIKEKFGIPIPGDILMTAVGTIGKFWIVPNSKPFYYKDGNLVYIRTKEFNPLFLKKLLEMLIEKYKVENANGSAYTALTIEKLKDLQIVLPPMTLQKQYEEFYIQIDKSKFLLQKILEKLELLKKSRFVEMFGDPVLNPYKLKKDSFRHICEELFAGGDKPSDIVLTKDETHPYPVYANGYENLGFMGFSSQCRVNKPAITISARGTIGFSCIRQAGFTPIVRLLTLIPKTGIDLDYLKFAIDFYSFTSSGTSQKQLTVPDIAKYEVLVPDYSSQQCFATFVHQLDKLKLVIQKSLEDLVGKS